MLLNLTTMYGTIRQLDANVSTTTQNLTLLPSPHSSVYYSRHSLVSICAPRLGPLSDAYSSCRRTRRRTPEPTE